jgi:hypothetical protein
MRPKFAISIGVTALVLSACSSGDDSGIASLDTPGSGPSASPGSGATAEEQALAFAQCMRDNGVDFPDPTVNADGVPTFEGAFAMTQGGGMDPSDTTFRDAQQACGSLMEGIAFGGGPGGPGGRFDPSEMEDAMLPYTECLRDQGLDVGDFSLEPSIMGDGGDARPAPEVGATAGTMTGPAPGEAGPGFDRGDMLARMLDQDPDDPTWIAASAACEDLLADTSFAGNGGGFIVSGGGEG